MSQNRFWYLLAKNLSGEALPAETAELEMLIKEHPEWNFAAEQLEGLWKLRYREPDLYDAELAYEFHLNEHKKDGLDFPEPEIPAGLAGGSSVKDSGKSKWLWLPVLFILASGLAGLIWKFNKGRDVVVLGKALHEVSTLRGSRTKLVLPDSSVVWLNAGSKLTYDEQFGITNRATTLTGEAYFEVRKSTIPFTIQAHSVHIRVLGTVFNVKSYPNEKTTETSLIRGRVEITLEKRPGEKFILKPDEKLMVANDPEDKGKEPVQKQEPKVVLSGLSHTPEHLVIETSWIDNKLAFQDESLEDIAKKMERWYDVRIEVRDEMLGRMRLTGTFTNESIRQALTALQIAFPFHFEINDKQVIITQ